MDIAYYKQEPTIFGIFLLALAIIACLFYVFYVRTYLHALKIKKKQLQEQLDSLNRKVTDACITFRHFRMTGNVELEVAWKLKMNEALDEAIRYELEWQSYFGETSPTRDVITIIELWFSQKEEMKPLEEKVIGVKRD